MVRGPLAEHALGDSVYKALASEKRNVAFALLILQRAGRPPLVGTAQSASGRTPQIGPVAGRGRWGRRGGAGEGEIEERVQRNLAQLWEEGILGADFFMSAIGPAVEAFGRYARVEKLSSEKVGVAELLEYVRKVVAEFALGRILQGRTAVRPHRLANAVISWY